MSARTDLRDLIAADAPSSWDIIAYPAQLAPLDAADKPVAIVIEQRTLTAGRTSPDDNGVPVDVELVVWVIVDATRGDDRDEVEDRLEAAAEQMILILEKLPEHSWDGSTSRNQYDPQKPAYDFTIRAQGALIPEETTP